MQVEVPASASPGDIGHLAQLQPPPFARPTGQRAGGTLQPRRSPNQPAAAAGQLHLHLSLAANAAGQLQPPPLPNAQTANAALRSASRQSAWACAPMPPGAGRACSLPERAPGPGAAGSPAARSGTRLQIISVSTSTTRPRRSLRTPPKAAVVENTIRPGTRRN